MGDKDGTVLIFTKKGWVVRTNIKYFPIQKRGGLGVKAIALKEGDEVVAVVAG